MTRQLNDSPMRILDIDDCVNDTCPWSGKPVQADSLTEFEGQVVGFCNPGCRDKFEAAVRHFERARTQSEDSSQIPDAG